MFAELEFVETHSPIFLAGTNLGQKLDPKKRQGLKLSFDIEHNRTWIEFNGKACFITVEGVIVPSDPTQFGYEPASKFKAPPVIVQTAPGGPVARRMKATAQVSDPTRGPR